MFHRNRGQKKKDGAEESAGMDWLEKSVARTKSIRELPKGARLTPFDPYTLSLGDKAPEVLPAFIEVSAGSRNKYEWDQDIGVLMLDRVSWPFF